MPTAAPVLLLHVVPSEGRWIVTLNGRCCGGPHADPVRAIRDCQQIERSIRSRNPAAVLHTYIPPDAHEATVAAARRAG